MKLNIANPATGAIKSVEIDDEKKLRIFYEKRLAQEVSADGLGDEFKGYIFKITGGNDKQGFPAKQGVMTNGRRRLLLSAGHSCYRPRRDGERKTKSVRGCIIGPDMSALNLVIVKKGEGELPDLTDKYVPRRLGPKRASKIRKLFNLSKEDDVRKYVIRRTLPDRTKGEKTLKRTKAPKIQRLITPRRLQHKRREFAEKNKRVAKAKEDAADYAKLMAQRKQQEKARRASEVSKRRSERVSQKGETSATETKKGKDAPEGKPAKPEKAGSKKAAVAAVAKAAAAAAPKITATAGAKAEKEQQKVAAAVAKPAAKEAKKAPAKPAAPAAKKQKK